MKHYSCGKAKVWKQPNTIKGQMINNMRTEWWNTIQRIKSEQSKVYGSYSGKILAKYEVKEVYYKEFMYDSDINVSV